MSEQDDRLEIERLERIGATVCQLEADRDALKAKLADMAAAKELAERQVAVLCKQIGETGWCPTEQTCQSGKTGCSGCWAAWSRAEAKKGG